jgi:pullulanase
LPRIGGDWALKEDENKFWDASFGNEIYLIGGIHHIWRERPDTRQQILAAFIDTPHCIVIELSRPVDPGEMRHEHINLMDEHGQRVKTSHIAYGDKPSNALKLKTQDVLDVGLHTYSVNVENFAGTVLAGLRDILNDASLFFDNTLELGARYTPAQTIFRLFAPTANAVHVVLSDEPSANARFHQSYSLHKVGKGIFEAVIQGDWNGKFYRYRLEGQNIAAGLDVLDPYAVNVINHYGRITYLSASNPSGWEISRSGPAVESPVDMVIYEMHVRDFTSAENSGVANKGKYLGFTETGTRLPSNSTITTGLDHLQELGITHVQLLPVQSFNRGGDDWAYNWGYMTVAFNSPESWYATRPYDDSRIREFKQLVSALHARNIGVIMDVVYNHTDHSAPFSSINANYYFRLYPNGSYANGSGVGNDFRSEAPMVRRFIIDSLKYWVTEYGVDGFRFDLMALLDIETMRAIEYELRKLNPHIVLYGEPWSCGFSPIRGQPTDKQAIRNTGIGAFNDHFRNALGGNPNGSEPGFLQNGSHRDLLLLGLEGSCHDWATSPAQSINYMTCHDNLVLYDKLRWFNPAASEQDILATIKLGYLLLLTAQGVPFLHGGEEFARTKYGHGNSYNAGDQINQIDWSLKAENYPLFVYTRDLIALRKQHPVFRLRTAESIRERVKFHLAPTEKSLVYSLDGVGLEQETWPEACVLANAEEGEDREFTLPPGRWCVAFNHLGLADESQVVEYRLTVPRKSGVILRKIPDCAENLDTDKAIIEFSAELPETQG